VSLDPLECEHGQLSRSCDRCEDAAVIEGLRADNRLLAIAVNHNHECEKKALARVAELEAALIRVATEAGRVVQEAQHHSLPALLGSKLRGLEAATGATVIRAALGKAGE
jgi:hypothetical protein